MTKRMAIRAKRSHIVCRCSLRAGSQMSGFEYTTVYGVSLGVYLPNIYNLRSQLESSRIAFKRRKLLLWDTYVYRFGFISIGGIFLSFTINQYLSTRYCEHELSIQLRFRASSVHQHTTNTVQYAINRINFIRFFFSLLFFLSFSSLYETLPRDYLPAIRFSICSARFYYDEFKREYFNARTRNPRTYNIWYHHIFSIKASQNLNTITTGYNWKKKK